MRKKSHGIERFVNDETGAAMVEYGLLVALISVTLITTLQAVTVQLQAVFMKVATELRNAAGS